jgi:uncharacterized protein (TIGR02145 family)
MKNLTFIFLLVLIGCQKDPFTDSNSGTFKDSRDQLEYKWIRIGEQIWMAENLKYLPAISQFGTGSETEKMFYVSDYEGTDINAARQTTNYQSYGVLYNGIAASDACPSGWHLPTDGEWYILGDYLGQDAGKKLKSSTGWAENGNGDNTSGFNALPGGFCFRGLGMTNVGTAAGFWTTTLSSTNKLLYRYLMSSSDRGLFMGENATKDYGFSIRCIHNN